MSENTIFTLSPPEAPKEFNILFSFQEKAIELRFPSEDLFKVAEMLNSYLNSNGIESYLVDKSKKAAIE